MKCPQCAGVLIKDWDWTPELGYDNRMEKFTCVNCKRDIYITRARKKDWDTSKPLTEYLNHCFNDTTHKTKYGESINTS